MRVRTDLLDRGAHLVELVRAYVRAIREAKVDQTPLPEQVILRERLALVRQHLKRPTDVRAPDGAGLLLFFCGKFRLRSYF